MITMIVYVKRAKGMTREEFSKYWFDNHAPLVLGTPEFMRHVRKYIQYHYAPGEAEAGSLFGDIADDYDGVGEIWFDSREAMNAALNEPVYLKNVKPDEHRFIDLDNCLSFVAEERVIYVDEKYRKEVNA